MVRISQAKKRETIEIGEFWTAKQRQSHSLHYIISYRASFKPELPSFFINEFLSGKKGQIVLDPFGGRGTTTLQANLEGQFAIHNDINPLSVYIAKARQFIPSYSEIEKKLAGIDLKQKVEFNEKEKELLHFFHPNTLKEIINLKEILKKDKSPVMSYIGLTALSRLHGHSNGFFSVYTFPQISISPLSQKKNNEKRNQKPEYKEIKSRILSKAKRDLKESLPPFYTEFAKKNLYLNEPSTNLKSIKDASVDLVITSPPFLDKVNYIEDNWMKAWFLDIDSSLTKGISILSSLEDWKNFIHKTLKELSKKMKVNSFLVMEVGEVEQNKKLLPLDETVIQASMNSGFIWEKTYINSQKFTKLSNCWNVSNNEKGTNSNRCVVLRNIKF
jgi:DNA modification methylase